MWVFIGILLVLIGIVVIFYMPTGVQKNDEKVKEKTQESSATSVADNNGAEDE